MAAPADPPPPSRRWLMPALIVSLAVNLAGLGVLFGLILGAGTGAGARVPVEPGAMPALAALDSADRAALRAAWRREGPGLRALRAERQAETAALVMALRADPFDRAALEAVLLRQNAALAERQSLAQRLLVDRLAEMDAAGRAAFADRLEAAVRRGPPARTERDRQPRDGRPAP